MFELRVFVHGGAVRHAHFAHHKQLANIWLIPKKNEGKEPRKGGQGGTAIEAQFNPNFNLPINHNLLTRLGLGLGSGDAVVSIATGGALSSTWGCGSKRHLHYAAR